MTAAKKHPKEPYLTIPYHILNNPALDVGERVLLAIIYSYGVKGCWASNETLGKIFFIKKRAISQWMSNLKKAGCIFWVHPKGRYRTVWAKTHPDVRAAQELLYMGEKISKEAVIKGHAAKILQRTESPGGIVEMCAPTAHFDCIQVRTNVLHTNNTTSKDTIKKTTAPPSPLPAGGQAPAVLEQRKQVSDSNIRRFCNNFGKADTSFKLSDQEWERRRQENINCLDKAESSRLCNCRT